MPNKFFLTAIAAGLVATFSLQPAKAEAGEHMMTNGITCKEAAEEPFPERSQNATGLGEELQENLEGASR